jgi:hypothetical protein
MNNTELIEDMENLESLASPEALEPKKLGRKPKYDKELILRHLRAGELTYAEIAGLVNCTPANIGNIAFKNEIKRGKGAPGKDRNTLATEWGSPKYAAQNQMIMTLIADPAKYSRKQIAEMIGIPVAHVNTTYARFKHLPLPTEKQS